MASRKPRLAVNAKAPPYATKVTKTKAKKVKAKKAKAKKTKSTTASTSATATALASTYRVKRYRNGILNLEKTPTHLVAIAKRNAAESPLLRLPAEIRNCIWSFAMGGKLIVLPDRKFSKGCAVKIELNRADDPLPTRRCPYPYNHTTTKVPAAFHMPEVCRQIYAETALTAYQQSTFIIDVRHMSTKNSMTRLMAAQRRAITSVLAAPEVLTILLSEDLLRYFKPMTEKLPNLKTILVSMPAMEWLQIRKQKYPATRMFRGEKMWQAWIVQKLKDVCGAEMEIQFEEGNSNWISHMHNA